MVTITRVEADILVRAIREFRPRDDLVEFAAVQPHTAAPRAVVDLDLLAHGHFKLRIQARRAPHRKTP